ncbi:MAG: TatD family hydrolase [Planctomycetota bacterium]|jgi:TatD DNase family protein
MLIDTHCHLTDRRLEGDLAAALARARQAGVAACICAAANVHDSESAAEIAAANEGAFCMAGVHPHDAGAADHDYLERLAELADRPENVAIGEIGLDYHYEFSARGVQQEAFAAQVGLAARLGKPVVVHTREALPDTLAILRQAGARPERVVFHSFTGGGRETQQVLEPGFWVSYSGIVTFNKADALREAAAAVPDDRIMVETDSPYLSPEPVRKMKTNEPANVVHVARRLAHVRGAAPEDFAALTTANAVRFFALDIDL